MDFVVSEVNRNLNLTNNKNFAGDPRVTDWPLMDGPGVTFLLTVLYLIVVKYGPSFMASRQPFKGKWLMVTYNLTMVGFSFYLCVESFTLTFKKNYPWICVPIDPTISELGYREASVTWWFFITKLIEFLDTILFILRKKNGQVTFLHVYHHSTLPLVCWYVAKYAPGAEKLYIGAFNTFVHTIMYSYYGLSALGPWIQPYLWWKKYLTSLQMVQFVCTCSRCMLSAMSGPGCYPCWLNVGNVLYSGSFFCLFFHFYNKSYSGQKRPAPHNSASAKHVANGNEKSHMN